MESSRDTDKLQSENRGGDLSYTATTLGRRGEKNARNYEWGICKNSIFRGGPW